MSIYSLQTSLGIGVEFACNVFGINSEACKIAQENFPQAIGLKKFPSSNENISLNEDELNSIIAARLKRLEKSRNFGLLAVGDSDYLFSEFLERGLRCSDAVCLLEREFQLEDLIDKIKDRPTKDFPEVLRRLSQKLGLRPEKEPRGSEDRWIDANNPNKRVLEALEDPDVKEELDALRKRISEQLNEEEKRRESTINIPFATGFLVGKNYLMTNFHVFNEQNKEEINFFSATFRYEKNVLGEDVPTINYQLDPEVCISDEYLDFTIVGVKAREDYKLAKLSFPEAGDNFGWFPMLADPTLVAPPINRQQILESSQEISFQIPRADLAGEPVFIIQHPRGSQKRIVIFNNFVQEMYQKFFKYETDTDFGASGSPVVNQRWQLVGLHHSTIAKIAIDQEPEIQGNLGTRMCAIVDFLEKNNGNTVAQALLTNNRYVVKTDDVPLKGTINILVGYQRQNAPSLDYANQEVDIAKFLLEKILEDSEPSLPMNNILELAGSYEDGIEYLDSRQLYQNGDIAVDIRTNFYPPSSQNQTRDITIYYANNKPELKAYADILLSKLGGSLGKIEPVETGSNPSLRFCDVINVPALVICFDFYGINFDFITEEINPSIQQQRLPFSVPVTKALKDLVKVISPIGFWSRD